MSQPQMPYTELPPETPVDQPDGREFGALTMEFQNACLHYGADPTHPESYPHLVAARAALIRHYMERIGGRAA